MVQVCPLSFPTDDFASGTQGKKNLQDSLYNIVMLFLIKFISDEVDGFLRELKIDSDATFLDLNKAVLESCGYPDDQMTSFYICDEEWERGQQVTREDMGVGDADEDIFVMDETRLSELIEDEGQHLEFVFDPFSDRSFYIDVKDVIPGESLDNYVITRAKGNAPAQIAEMDFDPVPAKGKKAGVASVDDNVDFDDPALFGGASFNDDEIDLEGFEISDGTPY